MRVSAADSQRPSHGRLHHAGPRQVVVFSASEGAVVKTVTLAEQLKRVVPGLKCEVTLSSAEPTEGVSKAAVGIRIVLSAPQ